MRDVRAWTQNLTTGPILSWNCWTSSPFQVTDVAGARALPIRRLVAAGCSADHCLVYYERGGIAHTWQVALFHWTPAATRFEWGGVAPGGLMTIDDVRKAVLSGAIKSSNKDW